MKPEALPYIVLTLSIVCFSLFCYCIGLRSQLNRYQEDAQHINNFPSKQESLDEINDYLEEVLSAGKGHIFSFFTYYLDPKSFETIEPLVYSSAVIAHPKSYQIDLDDNCLILNITWENGQYIEHRIYGSPGEEYTLVTGDKRSLVIGFNDTGTYIVSRNILFTPNARLSCINLATLETTIRHYKSCVSVELADNKGSLLLKSDEFRVRKDALGKEYEFILGPEWMDKREKTYHLKDIESMTIHYNMMKVVPSSDGYSLFSVS